MAIEGEGREGERGEEDDIEEGEEKGKNVLLNTTWRETYMRPESLWRHR